MDLKSNQRCCRILLLLFVSLIRVTIFCNVLGVDVIKRRDLDKLIKNPACPMPDLSYRMQLRDTIFVLSICRVRSGTARECSFLYLSENKKIFCKLVEHLWLAIIYNYAVFYPYTEFVLYVYPRFDCNNHV